MMDIFEAGIVCLKEDGISKCIRKVVNWIPQYVSWKKIVLATWLCDHNDVYRRHYSFKRLKRKEKVDSYIKIKKLEGMLQYCQEQGQEYKVLNIGEKVEVVSPKCFETKETIEKTIFDCPPIYLTMFQNATVYGATNIISVCESGGGQIALADIIYKDKEDLLKRYSIEGGSVIGCQRNGKYIYLAYKKTDIVIKEAINCFGWACKNYYHFTLEILSRLAFVDKFEEYRSVPILVDSIALQIPQMKELLEKVNVYRHPIIPIEEYHSINVEKLIYISRNMWMAPDFKRGAAALSTDSDYLISRSAVDNIRNRVLPIQEKKEAILYKKIFVPRGKGYYQRLSNMDKITKVFCDAGYHIVHPEELTFEEEVNIFNKADIIVAVTGSALTNTIYCHEGAQIGIIAVESHPMYSFSFIGNTIKVAMTVLGADIVYQAKGASLDTFILNEDKCLRFINELEKQ